MMSIGKAVFIAGLKTPKMFACFLKKEMVSCTFEALVAVKILEGETMRPE